MAACRTISQVADLSEAQQEMKRAFEEAGIGPGLLTFIIVLGFLSSLMLILSGVGYLGQRKVLGRGIGNAWAILSLASTGVNLVTLPAEAGGFNLMTILGLIYPLLTLLLLNTTFKEDFIR